VTAIVVIWAVAFTLIAAPVSMDTKGIHAQYAYAGDADAGKKLGY
jgi:hypothetical protein